MSSNLVIIGGGAGGASTAAEAKRNDPSLNITILERGKYVSFAACPMPYYIADEVKKKEKLIIRTPEQFREQGIDVRVETEVLNIDYNNKTVEIRNNPKIPFDTLVLATGTKSIVPDLPMETTEGVFTLKKLDDAFNIKAYIQEKKCRKAIIIGAGFIAMEMCESLQRVGIQTTIFHRGTLPANRWDPELSQFMLDEIKANGVEFIPEIETKAIEKGKDFALCAVTDKRVTGKLT